jgi:hypothetical protein
MVVEGLENGQSSSGTCPNSRERVMSIQCMHRLVQILFSVHGRGLRLAIIICSSERGLRVVTYAEFER